MWDVIAGPGDAPGEQVTRENSQTVQGTSYQPGDVHLT